MSVWCILAAPLIIGSDIRALSAMALATLSNPRAIAIDQDIAMNPPFQPSWSTTDHKDSKQAVVWARELAATSQTSSSFSSSSSAPPPSVVKRRVAVSVTNMIAAPLQPQPAPQPQGPVSISVSMKDLGLSSRYLYYFILSYN